MLLFFKMNIIPKRVFLDFLPTIPTPVVPLRSPLMSFILSPTVLCNTLGRNKIHGDLYIIYFVFLFISVLLVMTDNYPT